MCTILFTILFTFIFFRVYMHGYLEAQKEVCDHLLKAIDEVGNSGSPEFTNAFWNRFDSQKDPWERIVAWVKKTPQAK